MDRAILLVSHGNLAVSMRASVELITGKQPHLFTLPMDEQATLDSFTEELSNKTDDILGDYENLLILSDIKSGTPCNAAIQVILKNKNVDLITGFHLGLVIESCISDSAPNEIINNTLIGIKYINDEIK